jgi:hypothetical protein
VPDGWFAHSGEAEVGVGPCELFAADPFELTRNDNGRWEGVQVSLFTFVGCLGSFETVVEEEAVELDGVAGWRRTMESAEGGGQIGLRAYEYVVAAGPIDCEERRWFIARTESDDPGSFEENSAILDEMMESVEFDD